MKILIKNLLVIFFVFLSVSLCAQLDPANPPTDDLDYEEIMQRINAMLPITPDLLQFSSIGVFRFGEWPAGIVDAGAGFQEAFSGYSIKTDNNLIYLLDKAGYSIFSLNPLDGRQQLVASDFLQKNILFADFCRLRSNRLAVADNSRTALLFFNNNNFYRNIGFDGNRILFRHLDFIEADRLGLNLAAFDSGRNRTYVFNADGVLQWESEGRTEPCFFGNSLIKFEKEETELRIGRVSDISREMSEIAVYRCQPGNIILDAWSAGTFSGKLAVVVYEGRGDEDNPDYARLLLIKDGKIETHRFQPNLDMRLSLQTPYRLLFDRSGLQLITARIAENGIEIIGAKIK